MYIYKLATLPDEFLVQRLRSFYLKRALIIDEWPNRLRELRD